MSTAGWSSIARNASSVSRSVTSCSNCFFHPVCVESVLASWKIALAYRCAISVLIRRVAFYKNLVFKINTGFLKESRIISALQRRDDASAQHGLRLIADHGLPGRDRTLRLLQPHLDTARTGRDQSRRDHRTSVTHLDLRLKRLRDPRDSHPVHLIGPETA